MKRLLLFTLLISAVSMKAGLFEGIEEAIEGTTDVATTAIEGAADVAEGAVATAGAIAAAPFGGKVLHTDPRNGSQYYVDNGARVYVNGNEPEEYTLTSEEIIED